MQHNMGKKRKSSAASEGPTEEPEGAPKKPKSPEVEFTGTLFKSLVRDPQTALRGLQQFLDLSRKLPNPALYDVVEGYIKISVECTEILKLLDGEKRPESEMMILFQVLEAILLRTAGDLAHLGVAGVNIVKNLLNSHMKLVYAAVYSESHRMSRIGLNLLSAMVTQGPDCARDVFSHFDFTNKFLSGLLKKKDKQGRPDVRMAYIQFALSFFISGDNSTITQVLELKDFLGEIFNSGLKEEKVSTINLLLSLLQTKVVHNKAITKTQKVRFFTPVILSHIASLYRWNGIVDVSTKDVQDTKDSSEAGKLMIRELVHNFLMDLCCSLKHGINFYDPSLGTAARAGNLVLLQFLVGLKTATEDELLGTLVVNVLKVCPDLLSRYFKEIQYSFIPRVKSAWLDNINLLKKIYEAQPAVSVAFRTTEFVPLPRLLSMVMITTVPPVCSKSMFTQGLNVPNKIVKQSTLSLMSAVLKKAEQNVTYCLTDEVWQKSDIYTPATMADFAQKYREALGKLLPDVNTIVATWQLLLKPEETDAGEKGEDAKSLQEKHGASAAEDFPGLAKGNDDFRSTLVKASLLRVLCLYQRVVPHLVSQSNFDFSKLLRGIVDEQGVRKEVPPVLQHQILQVTLELPASRFSWFKMQEAADAGGEKSVFYLLLKMFMTSNKAQLKSSTQMLVIKILRDSGVFDHNWTELEMWLRRLDQVQEGSQEAIIHFLEQALVRVVSDPYPYTDKVTDCVQEASVVQTSSGQQDSDSASIPISHIDDVMDMVDVLVETSEGLDEEVGVALDEEMILQAFPFSPLVMVALEARNKLLTSEKSGDADAVIQYLTAILMDVLHSQRDPLALCLAFQSYDEELASLDPGSSVYSHLQNFYNYYSLWFPPSAKKSVFTERDHDEVKVPEESEENSYPLLLKKVFVSGSTGEDSQEDLKASISRISQDALPLAVKHTLLCLKTTVDDFSKYKKATGGALVDLYLDLLSSLLCKYQKEDQSPKEEEPKTDSDLFLESDTSAPEPLGNMVLDIVLPVVFKHPLLESWFLALERQSAPMHNLNPVSVKLLSSRLNQGIIQLLQCSAPLLQQTGSLHLVAKYFDAIYVSVLKVLEKHPKPSSKMPHSLEALQRLHPYMDTMQLNEVTLLLLKLPEECLLKDDDDDDSDQKLTNYGAVLVQLLNDSHQRKQCQEDLSFSVEHARGVGHLLSTSAGSDLGIVLIDALRREPALAHVVEVDTLTHCLSKMNPTSLTIAGLLVERSKTHRLQFELWCLHPGRAKLLRKRMETFLPVIDTYLKSAGCWQFTQITKVSAAVLQTLKDAFWEKLVKRTLRAETSERTAEHIAVLSKLVPLADGNEVEPLMEALPEVLALPSAHDRWAVADCISQAADGAGVKGCSWRRSLLAACMKCLTTTYGTSKEPEEAAPEEEIVLLSRLKDLMSAVNEDVPTEWNNLVKSGLKHRYKDCAFLEALRSGIERWYTADGPCTEDLLQLPVIHMMVTQHSLFLPSFLRSRDEETVRNPIRESLADLLRSIVTKCPSVCDRNHFAAILGAYGASLGVTDQKILFLLQAYELNNLSLTDFRLLLWGPAAVEHHKTRKSLGKSLWQQPSMEEILTLLDRDKMMKTVLNFPLHRKLTAEPGKSVLYEDRAIQDLHSIYDPCFLLPLFSELLRPELVVDCVKFVEMNALGLTFAALSSYDHSMRAAAYHVLGSFMAHMEGARFRDKKQLQCLLDVVKNGIRLENVRLAFALGLFGARAAQVLLRPEEHMYIRATRFLLSYEYLDLRKVPDFYRLFYSSDVEHKVEREWILTLLSDGMRDKYCYELYDYQRIFMVIMCYYNSPLCDEAFQSLVMDVFLKASKIPKAAYELIRDHSLLTWIQNMLGKWYMENKPLSNVITLLHNLWFSNLGKKGKAKSKEEQEKTGEQEKFLPLHLVNEMLSVLMILLRHIRTNLDGVHIQQYFGTLSSVLRYRTRLLEAFAGMGRFVINEQIFSNSTTLLLLQKWSVVERDLDLQEKLSRLAKDYHIKELKASIKEKFRQPGSRLLKKKLGAELETDEEKVSDLGESKNDMKSILIHWKPTFMDPSSAASAKDNGESSDQIGDETTGEDGTTAEDGADNAEDTAAEDIAAKDRADSAEDTAVEDTAAKDSAEDTVAEDTAAKDSAEDTTPEDTTSNDLVCATACLVTKWVMVVEGGHTGSVQDLSTSLRWLKTSILPHTGVVQELLKDVVLRTTFYKLFYRVCESPDSTPELLELTNQVMLNLIESQNLTKDRSFNAVKENCLQPGDDDTQKAAGSLMASIYIGDIWLGADSLVTFRSHVKLVCEAADLDVMRSKEKTPVRKRRTKDEAAIVTLCRKLSSVLAGD